MIEIILTAKGTRIVNVCTACIAGDADANCTDEGLEYVRELVKDGHVTDLRDPGDIATEGANEPLHGDAHQVQGLGVPRPGA